MTIDREIFALRPGVVHQPPTQPPAKAVVDQQRIIRNLSKRRRELRNQRTNDVARTKV
jgi:hypothetical protein